MKELTLSRKLEIITLQIEKGLNMLMGPGKHWDAEAAIMLSQAQSNLKLLSEKYKALEESPVNQCPACTCSNDTEGEKRHCGCVCHRTE